MARNVRGPTPLHLAAFAARRSTNLLEDDPGVIEALLAAGAAPLVRNAERKTPSDVTQAPPLDEDAIDSEVWLYNRKLEELRELDANWKLNDARFKATPQSPPPSQPSPLQPTPRTPAEAAPRVEETCEIPGCPEPDYPQVLDLQWCPANVGFQVWVFALQTAGAQGAIALCNSSTPEQIQTRWREIEERCKQLDVLNEAFNVSTKCRCPVELRPRGVDRASVCARLLGRAGV